MQLMVSRSYPVIDAQTLTEYVTCEALFRVADGAYFLRGVEGAGRRQRAHPFFRLSGRLALAQRDTRRTRVILAFRPMRKAALSSAKHRLGPIF